MAAGSTRLLQYKQVCVIILTTSSALQQEVVIRYDCAIFWLCDSRSIYRARKRLKDDRHTEERTTDHSIVKNKFPLRYELEVLFVIYIYIYIYIYLLHSYYIRSCDGSRPIRTCSIASSPPICIANPARAPFAPPRQHPHSVRARARVCVGVARVCVSLPCSGAVRRRSQRHSSTPSLSRGYEMSCSVREFIRVSDARRPLNGNIIITSLMTYASTKYHLSLR
jgi:hypothetical protein